MFNMLFSAYPVGLVDYLPDDLFEVSHYSRQVGDTKNDVIRVDFLLDQKAQIRVSSIDQPNTPRIPPPPPPPSVVLAPFTEGTAQVQPSKH